MSKQELTERKDFPVLVFDAHERMSIAVIRSLGRAGYPVHACSPFTQAAGLRSAFTAKRAISPPVDDESFLQWLRCYCITHQIRCLVPTEPVLIAIRPAFQEFSKLLPLSNEETTVYRGINKFDLFDMLSRKETDAACPAPNLPPLVLVRRGEEAPSEATLESLGLPIFLKVDGSYSVNRQSATYSAASVSEARMLLRKLLTTADRLVMQGYVPGIGAGAFLLRWREDTLGQYMHIRRHEIPLRGWSSYSESWQHDEILDDAKAQLARLGWQGAAMMEYRWNSANGKFALIEMNGRFWGSLHLALYAGMDLPKLLLDAFRGAVPVVMPAAQIGVKCRDPILDLQYVWSQCRSPKPGLIGKFRLMGEYIRLSLDPRVKSALLFQGDRQLFFWICWQYFVNFSKKLSSRIKRSE